MVANPAPPLQALVDDLRAEHATLDDLVSAADDAGWLTGTPAPRWDVRDSIAHLATFDAIARACLDGDPEPLARVLAGRPADVEAEQLARGRRLPPVEVLAWWRAARRGLVDALLACPPDRRVPWGAGPMSVASLASARLMECWAHGLDCFAALGQAPVDTDRIRHVCHLAYRSLPYALRRAGRTPIEPLDALRIDLTGPSGARWSYGAEDAPNRVEGDAGVWARRAVGRLRGPGGDLRTRGALAREAVQVVRAYL